MKLNKKQKRLLNRYLRRVPTLSEHISKPRNYLLHADEHGAWACMHGTAEVSAIDGYGPENARRLARDLRDCRTLTAIISGDTAALPKAAASEKAYLAQLFEADGCPLRYGSF